MFYVLHSPNSLFKIYRLPIIWGPIPILQTDPSLPPSSLLLSFLPLIRIWVDGWKQCCRKPSSVSIHSHQITGTRREERREERRSWDRLGLSQRAVSQSVGWSVGMWGSAKEILPSHSGVGCSRHLLASQECAADVDAIVNAGWYDGR